MASETVILMLKGIQVAQVEHLRRILVNCPVELNVRNTGDGNMRLSVTVEKRRRAGAKKKKIKEYTCGEILKKIKDTSKAAVAKELEVSRSTFYKKLRENRNKRDDELFL